jgi:uncharacterized membrane protein HdeD (DUF308 family)
MRVPLVRNWWSLVLRGIVGVVLGLLTFAWPGITLAGLVLLFGAYALIDGIISLVGAVRAAQANERWGVSVLEGLVGIGAAIVTVLWPAITVIALLFVIAAWAIVTGVLEISAAIRLRQHIQGEWLLALGGVASVIFGFLVMMAPAAGALVLALWFGAYVLVFGVLMIALGIRLRGLRNSPLIGGPTIAAPAH